LIGSPSLSVYKIHSTKIIVLLKKEGSIFPTIEQCLSCVQVCRDLTSLYIPIYLVRLDERDRQLIILAGEELQVTITPNGKWRFL
jgi:Iap family predicted aminopeptidase